MRILLSAAEEGGCGLYRIKAPYDALKAQGVDVTYDLAASSITCILDREGNVRSVRPLEYDVVVFQRPMSRRSYQMIAAIQAQGIAVVVELDDDIWHIDPQNVFHYEWQPSNNRESNYTHLAKAVNHADLVTVSTPELARVVPNKKVRVLRNMVPEWYLSLEPDSFEKDGLSVVWTGQAETHPLDLNACSDGVVRAVRRAGAVFVGVGSEATGKHLGFNDGETLFSPWIDLANYPAAVKSHDVGIAPLRDTVFNRSKSYLKGLEYAALGLAFVGSPLPEYRQLAFEGVGEIANSRHDWYMKLYRLLTDEPYRAEKVECGLDFARRNTYEANAHLWVEAWEKAVKNRRNA